MLVVIHIIILKRDNSRLYQQSSFIPAAATNYVDLYFLIYQNVITFTTNIMYGDRIAAKKQNDL